MQCWHKSKKETDTKRKEKKTKPELEPGIRKQDKIEARTKPEDTVQTSKEGKKDRTINLGRNWWDTGAVREKRIRKVKQSVTKQRQTVKIEQEVKLRNRRGQRGKKSTSPTLKKIQILTKEPNTKVNPNQNDSEEVVTGNWRNPVEMFWGYRLGCILWTTKRWHHVITKCVTDFINFWVDNTIPTRTVLFVHWITSELKELLDMKKRAFRERELLRSVEKKLNVKTVDIKEVYRRKLALSITTLFTKIR